MDRRVRKPGGWMTVSLPDDVDDVTVASGQTDGQLSPTFIGIRVSTPTVIVQDFLSFTATAEEVIDAVERQREAIYP